VARQVLACPHPVAATSAVSVIALNLNNFNRLWVAAIRCHFAAHLSQCPSTESGVDRGFLDLARSTGSTIPPLRWA